MANLIPNGLQNRTLVKKAESGINIRSPKSKLDRDIKSQLLFQNKPVKPTIIKSQSIDYHAKRAHQNRVVVS